MCAIRYHCFKSKYQRLDTTECLVMFLKLNFIHIFTLLINDVTMILTSISIVQ